MKLQKEIEEVLKTADSRKGDNLVSQQDVMIQLYSGALLNARTGRRFQYDQEDLVGYTKTGDQQCPPIRQSRCSRKMSLLSTASDAKVWIPAHLVVIVWK